MSHYDQDIHCAVCKEYCFSCMPDEAPRDSYMCEKCGSKKAKRKGEKIFNDWNLRHDLKKAKLRLALSRKVRKILSGNEHPDLRSFLAACSQASQEIGPLGIGDICAVAYAYQGLYNATNVKITCLNMVSSGELVFDDGWGLSAPTSSKNS